VFGVWCLRIGRRADYATFTTLGPSTSSFGCTPRPGSVLAVMKSFARRGAPSAVLTVTQLLESRHLSRKIPAGDIDPGLHIRMSRESGVHESVEFREFARIVADQMWPALFQSPSNSFRIRCKIERPERTDFAVTDQSVIGTIPSSIVPDLRSSSGRRLAAYRRPETDK